ncbi:MAG: malto-oligosyltrehalose synthase [Deltaproteobacteria bacterium]
MTKIPRATYRLQFHAGFTFDDAAALADYLEELGVSHLYCSPYLQAARGSSHGYDVVDPGKVNEELGGLEGHRRLCRALHDHGLGQILDAVPNHMAITGPENAWWWDVLENGPSSLYADYFDVDWDPPEDRLGNKILLPILGDRYGRCVERGDIQLRHENGRLFIRYYDHWLPVAPRSLADILDRAAERCGSDDLAFIADSFRHLPLPTATDRESTHRRHRNKEVIQSQFFRLLEESPEASSVVRSIIDEVNNSPDLLDDLLEEQNYRLAFWRTASQDLGYRRFFDINTLVALRIEEEKVFADTHRLILRWIQDGSLDGLRIDHPDGLRNPEQYLLRLRGAAPDAWIVVEKILDPDESLPSSWPVEGTTGYDFLNRVGGLFINPGGETPLTEFFAEFTGEETDYRIVVREKKHQVMRELLAGDVNRLTELLIQCCEHRRRYRDYTRYELNVALREIVACFPVYRTYIRPELRQLREEDRSIVTQAVEAAKAFQPELDPELFDFVASILLLELEGESETEFIVRFQQVTAPVMAKGVEDTAFYCFNRLISLNEVGGNPARFGLSIEEFHHAMHSAAELSPYSMLATSSHDTKRSEDVRARLALLSEIPGEWSDAVLRWAAHNETYRWEGVPDRNAEYLLYQTLVGAWPIETERVLMFADKAAREAKTYTSWTRPDPSYEETLLGFVQSVLEDREFVSDLEEFIAPLIEPGRVNSMSQTLIKLTAPGVPDFYQGTELWNLDLVDPDNRRPVDFELRRKLMAEITKLPVDEIMARMDEGVPKLWLIHRALGLRRLHPEIFTSGDYQPLLAYGEKAEHVIAFSRSERVVTVAPRLILTLAGDWGNTRLELVHGSWRNVLTGDRLEGGKVAIHGLLKSFPVALLWKES